MARAPDYTFLHTLTHHTAENNNTIATYPDSNDAVSGGNDDVIVKFEVQTGVIVARSEIVHMRKVWRLCIAPNGLFIVSCDWSDSVVKVRNAKTLKLEQSLTHDRGVRCIAVSPKSNLIAMGGYGGVSAIWEREGGGHARRL